MKWDNCGHCSFPQHIQVQHDSLGTEYSSPRLRAGSCDVSNSHPHPCFYHHSPLPRPDLSFRSTESGFLVWKESYFVISPNFATSSPTSGFYWIGTLSVRPYLATVSKRPTPFQYFLSFSLFWNNILIFVFIYFCLSYLPLPTRREIFWRYRNVCVISVSSQAQIFIG